MSPLRTIATSFYAATLPPQSPAPPRFQESPTPDLGVLMNRIANFDDRKAFQTLFAIVAPRLKTFLMRKGSSPEISEDIAQETLLRLWRKRGDYSANKGRIEGWVFRIARNLQIDGFRKTKNSPSQTTPFVEIAIKNSSENYVQLKEESNRLHNALSELPAEQGAVISATYFEGHTLRSAAKHLDIPEGTAKARARAGLQKLRKLLKGTQ